MALPSAEEIRRSIEQRLRVLRAGKDEAKARDWQRFMGQRPPKR